MFNNIICVGSQGHSLQIGLELLIANSYTLVAMDNKEILLKSANLFLLLLQSSYQCSFSDHHDFLLQCCLNILRITIMVL